MTRAAWGRARLLDARNVVGPLHQRFMRWRLGFLLGTLVLILLAYPFFDSQSGAGFLVTALTLTLIATIAALGFTRSRIIILIALAIPLVAFIWDDPLAHDNLFDPAPLVLLLLFLLVGIALLIDALRRSERVDLEELFGAVSVYFLLGMVFTVASLLVEATQPGSYAVNGVARALDWDDLLYFGYVSLATIGFGDITPVSDFARSIAVFAGMTGNLYIAIVIARFASLAPHPADGKKRARTKRSRA